jgi:hypothetical protein
MANLTPSETLRRLSEAEGRPINRQQLFHRAHGAGQVSGYDEGWVLRESQIRRVRRNARDHGYTQRDFLPLVTFCKCGLPAAIWRGQIICPDHVTKQKGLKNG